PSMYPYTSKSFILPITFNLFLLLPLLLPRSTFFPYTTLFRSLFFVSLIAFLFHLHPLASQMAIFFLSMNLLLTGLMTSSIIKEIGKSDKIANSLQQYAQMIKAFEMTTFQSIALKNIQSKLQIADRQATAVMGELANLFEKLNTIANLFIFIAFNGTFQYQFWVHHRLLKWKKKNQNYLWTWIQMIGEVE